MAPPAATGGQTHQIATVGQWDTAVASARPGDVLRLTQTINSRLVYRGQHSANPGSGADGRADAPIVITANPGVWVDPGNLNSGFGAIDVVSASHVQVDSVSVRNAQFGIRCMQCTGTAGSPIRITNNVVADIGHAGIYVGGHWQTHSPSSHVLVEANQVTRTGRSAPRYGEGIYLGYGGAEWLDTSSDIVVRNNNISATGAEGVDVKPGTRNVHVIGNLIHDLAPIDGGAISAHYVNLVPNPHPGQLDYVRVEGNRIWNLNLGGTSGSNDWAIWVGHGGVDIVDNVIWGLRSNPSNARAVRIRATQGFGPHPINIIGNTFWTARGWVAEGQPSGAANVVAIGNHGLDPSSSEIAIDASLVTGPAPAPGIGGTADAGGGPGSGLVLIAETSQLPALSPTPTPAQSPTPSTTASPPVSKPTPKTTPTAGGRPESVPSNPEKVDAIDPKRLGDVGKASGSEVGIPPRPSPTEPGATDPWRLPPATSSPRPSGVDNGKDVSDAGLDDGRRWGGVGRDPVVAGNTEPNIGPKDAAPADGLEHDLLVGQQLELAFVLDTLAAVQWAPGTGGLSAEPGPRSVLKPHHRPPSELTPPVAPLPLAAAPSAAVLWRSIKNSCRSVLPRSPLMEGPASRLVRSTSSCQGAIGFRLGAWE